ncbi:MAG: hypothetical protein HC938_03120 [Nitrospira sp.]|nr:hypothetical protein [Nitrospira sp.]
MHHAHGTQGSGGWEGSAKGIAYSEFNHRFAGLFVLLFGLAELGHALRFPLPFWSRLVLPSALAVIGIYLLVWSDHDGWPIGSLTVLQTFSGYDLEILQHKVYGVCTVMAAVSETLRRIGVARNPVWTAPMVFFGRRTGQHFFLCIHMGITRPHRRSSSIMRCSVVSAWELRSRVRWLRGGGGAASRPAKQWELVWAGFVIVMGIQVLVYSE